MNHNALTRRLALFAIVGPAGMPKEVVDKLNAATIQVSWPAGTASCSKRRQAPLAAAPDHQSPVTTP